MGYHFHSKMLPILLLLCPTYLANLPSPSIISPSSPSSPSSPLLCSSEGLCCPHRSSKCVVQVVHADHSLDPRTPCYCDPTCVYFADCCQDFHQFCQTGRARRKRRRRRKKYRRWIPI